MFKYTNIVNAMQVATSVREGVSLRVGSPLTHCIYHDGEIDESKPVDDVISFYNTDAAHEKLMESISTEASAAIINISSKIQNEYLGLVDDTFEDVMRDLQKSPNDDYITHRIHLIEEVKFLSSDYSMEVESIDTGNNRRTSVNRAMTFRLPARTASEIAARIRKSMTSDTFNMFMEMVSSLGYDLVDVYNTAIVGYESNVSPMASYGPCDIAYSHGQSVIAYHIAKSLIDTPDDEARLSESEYDIAIGTRMNNLLIRYKSSANAIEGRLNNLLENLNYSFEGDVIHLSIYAPLLNEENLGDISKDKFITNVLSRCVTAKYGPIPNTSPDDRYKLYHKSRLLEGELQFSSDVSIAIIKSLSNFVNTLHFEDWAKGNLTVSVTPDLRIKYMDDIAKYSRHLSIPSTETLYVEILSMISNIFYRGLMVSLITDMRTVMDSGEVDIHEALGISLDRFIVRYYVEMLVG